MNFIMKLRNARAERIEQRRLIINNIRRDAERKQMLDERRNHKWA